MKKFISALTSLTIAATALGSTFAMSSTAATNGTVDATEITFRTGGKDSISVKPGDKIPVDMYVTASAGFYTLNLKMVMAKDGKIVLGADGRGSSYDAAWLAANEPAEKLADIQSKINEINAGASADKQIPMVEDHWVYGTYGFTMSPAPNADENNGFATTDWDGNAIKLALDSGYYSSAGAAGTPGGSSFFVPENFSLTYFCEGAAKYTKGEGFGYADAYYGFESSGLNALKWLTGGTPINTWTSDESWVYDHVLNSFYLTVPEDAVPGEYTLGLLDPATKYYNPAAISWTSTYATKGDNTDNAMKWNALKITVEGETVQTTTSAPVVTTTTPAPVTTTVDEPVQTTTTPKVTTPISGEGYTLPDDAKPAVADGTLRFELLPDDEYNEVAYEVGYDASAKLNTIIAEPGAELYLKLTASSKPACAAQMIIMDFSQVTYGMSIPEMADAYTGIAPTVNDLYANTADSLGQKYVSVVWAATADLSAAEGRPVCLFNITVPDAEPTTANLVYTIKSTTAQVETKDKEGNTVIKEREISVIGDPDIEIPAEFIGLQIVVPSEVQATTTTEPKVTTTEPKVTTTEPKVTTTEPKVTTTEPKVTTTSEPFTTTAQVGDKVWGDTNEDGDVTIADVILLNKGMSGNAQLSKQANTNADTDNSGDLSTQDAYLIKGYLAKLIARGTTDPAKLDAAIAAQQ